MTNIMQCFDIGYSYRSIGLHSHEACLFYSVSVMPHVMDTGQYYN